MALLYDMMLREFFTVLNAICDEEFKVYKK